jgi:acyl-coenzyme A synthetase/AMP-(fatty) acid ligase
MMETVTLADRLDLCADGRFQLLGRDSDMIKVAGRRASLAEITRKLTSLPGVLDAVVFVPEQGDNARPAALVVAPGQTEAQLRSALAGLIDPIFIPRPMRQVAALPRNALGKMQRAELTTLLAKLHG